MRRSLLLLVLFAGGLLAQSQPGLDKRVQEIISRPEFRHAHFGIEIYSVERSRPIYLLNEQKLFAAASTTKLLTEGTALALLGPDYRFHTRIYRTGPVTNGVLQGDLVLVASGDPNLSNRIQPDGTLAFEDEDHSYGGPDSKGLPGDRLLVIRELARKVAAAGIKRVSGHLLVDATLFPEGEKELGTDVVLSPIVVNDNLVDVIASAGKTEGTPVRLDISPSTSYVNILSKATTGSARPHLDYVNDAVNSDGLHSVEVTGTLPAGPHIAGMVAYRVPEPSRYAAVLLKEALQECGVTASLRSIPERSDFKSISVHYTPANLVAEHVSPPLKEEVKITLKVSQNLHASMVPYLLGALVAKKTDDVAQAGFDLERDFLKRAGLDLSGASQSDGAGGDAYFSPEFMVQYLLYMSKQTYFNDFYRALPVLGKDGTLVKVQVKSPAAGHVHAKTGTFTTQNALNSDVLVTAKGLAGYMETAGGEHLIFAVYVNNVAVSADDKDGVARIGETLGEIATAAYESGHVTAPKSF